MIEVMEEAYVKVMADPNNLRRIGALDREAAAGSGTVSTDASARVSSA